MTVLWGIYIVLALNQSPCIKEEKKEVYFINLENNEKNQEPNYESNVIQLLYRILLQKLNRKLR